MILQNLFALVRQLNKAINNLSRSGHLSQIFDDPQRLN